jgi:hypothetical protein
MKQHAAAWLLCAWVLWTQPKTDPSDWRILEALETRRDCERAIATYNDLGVTKHERMLCLPSGADPRPRAKDSPATSRRRSRARATPQAARP